MLDLFQRGGVLMYIIAACSVIALAVLLERLWSLQRGRVVPASFVRKIHDLVGSGKTGDALVLCQNHSSSVAAVLAAGLKRRGRVRAEIKEAVQEVGRHEAANLERFVGVIGIVAAIAPLLGLLGTVTGMIRVFQDVTKQGVGNPADLASGIWEALLTTAYGLIVAIPALVAYRYVLSRVDGLVLEMEEDALEMVEMLEMPVAAPGPSTESPVAAP
ncbi:MAG: MotA/TolQ/ExbB proton channel family protein [Pseudomonadota bacterium]